jgi:rhomboid protease GluP
MNSNKIILELRNRGFEYIESNLTGISLLYKLTQESEDVCIIVDNSANIYFTGGQLESIEAQVERKFLLSGFNKVKIMFFVITNRLERDKNIAFYGINFWLLDVVTSKVIVYENQPEDYVNIRSSIEKILESKKEKVSYRTEKLPVINLLIIAANIIVFVILELLGSTEDTAFMLYHGASFGEFVFQKHQYYRLFTCMFIHFGSLHLINNMVTLLIVGNKVEQVLGKIKFLFIYILGGMGASLISTSYYYLRDDMVISGGASGAIFAIIGAFVILLLRNKKKVSFVLGFQFFLLIILILYNGMSSTKIDTIAHLAGLLFGMLFTYFFTRKSEQDL